MASCSRAGLGLESVVPLTEIAAARDAWVGLSRSSGEALQPFLDHRGDVLHGPRGPHLGLGPENVGAARDAGSDLAVPFGPNSHDEDSHSVVGLLHTQAIELRVRHPAVTTSSRPDEGGEVLRRVDTELGSEQVAERAGLADGLGQVALGQMGLYQHAVGALPQWFGGYGGQPNLDGHREPALLRQSLAERL